jgi:hypothetical protein
MIYFTKVNTRCGGYARRISWHFVFALAMLIVIMGCLTVPKNPPKLISSQTVGSIMPLQLDYLFIPAT